MSSSHLLPERSCSLLHQRPTSNFSQYTILDGRECPVVIGGDYITTESGTGLVHTAPGHGQEDYLNIWGLDVLGNGNVAVDYLDEHLSMVMVEPYKHKYPYDWRTKKPTIFRATEQWFASVEGFVDAAMDTINQVTWIPSQEPLMNEETIDHIKSIISQKGSDAWWYMTVEELLPEKYRDKASNYEKGTDTMDVWFDSGSSWAAVLDKKALVSLQIFILRGQINIVSFVKCLTYTPEIANTLRFLLANLHDWKADYTVPYSDLPMIDQHALFQLANVVNNIRESYDSYQFFKIFQLYFVMRRTGFRVLAAWRIFWDKWETSTKKYGRKYLFNRKKKVRRAREPWSNGKSCLEVTYRSWVPVAESVTDTCVRIGCLRMLCVRGYPFLLRKQNREAVDSYLVLLGSLLKQKSLNNCGSEEARHGQVFLAENVETQEQQILFAGNVIQRFDLIDLSNFCLNVRKIGTFASVSNVGVEVSLSIKLKGEIPSALLSRGPKLQREEEFHCAVDVVAVKILRNLQNICFCIAVIKSSYQSVPEYEWCATDDAKELERPTGLLAESERKNLK
ncbi:hypothetical protein HAX54_044422 [Datura stramonium]|uniref:Aminoacyl-tRNA synthetase class Ia domain-containing protein n=1 Tax=Datura stramonium TaxID=4076 RepID=A0ABS8WEK6_DATST|nr:hypothetical protein [Datura stramonium]